MFKNAFIKYIFLFLVGGFTYCLIEIIGRGYSHISMLIAGGLSFVIIGSVSNLLFPNVPTVFLMIFGAAVITLIELVTGIIVNERLNQNVWDYSNLSYNYRGQICLWYSLVWFFLSYSIIKIFKVLNDWQGNVGLKWK